MATLFFDWPLPSAIRPPCSRHWRGSARSGVSSFCGRPRFRSLLTETGCKASAKVRGLPLDVEGGDLFRVSTACPRMKIRRLPPTGLLRWLFTNALQVTRLRRVIVQGQPFARRADFTAWASPRRRWSGRARAGDRGQGVLPGYRRRSARAADGDGWRARAGLTWPTLLLPAEVLGVRHRVGTGSKSSRVSRAGLRAGARN